MAVTRDKPKPLMFRRPMTSEDFEIVAFAAVQAVAIEEGWCTDEHHSGNIDPEGPHSHYTPSRKFMAEFRRQLRDYNFVVLTKSQQI